MADSENHEDLIQTFCGITGADVEKVRISIHGPTPPIPSSLTDPMDRPTDTYSSVPGTANRHLHTISPSKKI